MYGKGICIDGYAWSIKIMGESDREIKGINGKPEDFHDFIIAAENLLQKDFGAAIYKGFIGWGRCGI